MKMTKSKMWLVTTLIIALITTILVMSFFKNIKEEAQVQEVVKVILAAKKIPQGTRLSAEMIKTVEMPLKYANPQWIREKDQVLDKFALLDFEADDVLIASKLTTEKTSNQLTYKVPQGKRAITTAINPASGVAGHIKPGDYVDVLVAYTAQNQDSSEREIQEVITLLQEVLVLAVGPDLIRKDEVQNTDTMTLAVSPDDAQKITLSESIGRIKLTLRPAGESGTSNLRKLNSDRLKVIFP